MSTLSKIWPMVVVQILLFIFWVCLLSLIQKALYTLFDPISPRLTFEYDLTSGCWNIPLLIFWGHLHLIPSIGCWDIPLFIFWGYLLLRSTLFNNFVHSDLFPIAKVSNLSKIRPVVAEIFPFLCFEVVSRWRSSSFDTFVHSGLIPIA